MNKVIKNIILNKYSNFEKAIFLQIKLYFKVKIKLKIKNKK